MPKGFESSSEFRILPCRHCGSECRCFTDTLVPTCADCREKAEYAEIARQRNEAFLAKVRPPLYAATLLERLPCSPCVVSAVESWRPSPEKPFLLLHGVTGRGKTRLMWLVLMRCILAGDRPVVFGPGEFSLQVASAWRDGSAEQLIGRVKSTPWLALDDIDKDKFTERVEEALFGVLEHRIAWTLPTILTTNATGAVLEEKFATAAGPAVIRRLREHAVTLAP